MEAFAPLPVDLFADNLLEEDPYFSLSQFDLELQQQAQAALLQQQNWQDFDKYLPIEQTFTRNVQAQPIFNQQQQQFNNNAFNDTSLLYEPMLKQPPVQQQQLSPIQEHSPPQNAFDKINNQVKQEYASPESLPHSPPSSDSTPLFNDSPRPSFDFMNWPTMDPTQAKVPIQRLKSNSIITNAVNAAMNNTTTTKHKKTAHNAIERRYRNNINDRITELKNAVPALLYAKVNNRTGKRTHDDEDEGEDGQEYLDGVAVATKLNKATILRKATEYINHLKKTGDDVRRENETLQHILAQLPGGSDILQRYKQTRESQLYQEEQQQQRKKTPAANRKRTKYKHSDDESPPPAMASRVFMAVFMSITFFSTSPTKEQNLHHTTSTDTFSFTNDTFLGSFFKFDDTWSSLRTIIFIICIVQLMFPYVKYMFFGSSLKLKRVKRTTTRKDTIDNAATPGDLKSRHIYTILNNNTVPEYNTLFPFCKELVRFFCHHVLGYDIMYGPEEEYANVCKWIKLNETRCIGGDLGATRFSMLFTCLRMINLVDTLDDGTAQARAYATAAMMMPLIFPNRYISDKLSDYLWLHVAKHDEDDEEDEDAWMQSLDLEYMRDSRAWSETIQVLQNQISLALEARPRSQLLLSYTAPVTAPVSILSTFHLLDTLIDQFNRLINNMSSPSSSPTEFVDIMLLAPDNDLVHWLATVGAMVESLWTNQQDDAEQYMSDLLRVPRAMSSSSHNQQLAHQQDELVKKIMVHTLVGTLLIKKKQEGGLQELENAQALRSAIRKSKYRYESNLESVVLALAEFVVCLVGLESWISAMKVMPEKEALIDEQVRDVTLHLRRMIRVPSLVNDNQSMVDRLSRLGRFMAHQEDDDELAIEQDNNKSDTALLILRG